MQTCTSRQHSRVSPHLLLRARSSANQPRDAPVGSTKGPGRKGRVLPKCPSMSTLHGYRKATFVPGLFVTSLYVFCSQPRRGTRRKAPAAASVAQGWGAGGSRRQEHPLGGLGTASFAPGEERLPLGVSLAQSHRGAHWG